jgi:hypothetical protein
VLMGGLPDAGSGEVFSAILRQAKEVEDMIGRTNAERANLAAIRTEGLSPVEAGNLAAFAEDIRAGFDEATAAERRELYNLLHIRGIVYADPNGVRLGRYHRFRIEWQCAIPLAHNENQLLKTVMSISPRVPETA